MKKNEVGRTYGTHGRGEKCVQGFGVKARGKWEDGIKMDLREIGWGGGVDLSGSG
jgi:hypothetical protein